MEPRNEWAGAAGCLVGPVGWTLQVGVLVDLDLKGAARSAMDDLGLESTTPGVLREPWSVATST